MKFKDFSRTFSSRFKNFLRPSVYGKIELGVSADYILTISRFSKILTVPICWWCGCQTIHRFPRSSSAWNLLSFKFKGFSAFSRTVGTLSIVSTPLPRLTDRGHFASCDVIWVLLLGRADNCNQCLISTVTRQLYEIQENCDLKQEQMCDATRLPRF